MCDSYAALPSATTTGTTLAAKNADCEINEAQAVLQLPRRRYPEGATMRASHIVIPQARETHEIIIDKSYLDLGRRDRRQRAWRRRRQRGDLQHGRRTGRRADHWRPAAADAGAGAQICDEAVEVFTDVLERFGQGGNCELRGNCAFRFQLSGVGFHLRLCDRNRRPPLGGAPGRGRRRDLQRHDHRHRLAALLLRRRTATARSTSRRRYEDISKVPVSAPISGRTWATILAESAARARSISAPWPTCCASTRRLRSGRRRGLHQHLHACRSVPDPLLAGLRRHDQRGGAPGRHGLGHRHVGHLRVHLQAGVFRHPQPDIGPLPQETHTPRRALVEARESPSPRDGRRSTAWAAKSARASRRWRQAVSPKAAS